jgi:hypothetical protein
MTKASVDLIHADARCAASRSSDDRRLKGQSRRRVGADLVAASGDDQPPRRRPSRGWVSGEAGIRGRSRRVAASGGQEPTRARPWLLATPDCLQIGSKHLMREFGEEQVYDHSGREPCSAANADLSDDGAECCSQRRVR